MQKYIVLGDVMLCPSELFAIILHSISPLLFTKESPMKLDDDEALIGELFGFDVELIKTK